ncbi:metal ABC transporter solute-binding protein, Zn/Mn family [Lichenicoccus roseus]|uniref:Cation ABC transporter substrate-binding protein n=1 Tax=Lichenicoccus roseus TaxID=2683649 RepID=A0A5R9J5T9_9PROT|nr:zinc ABC transporter substrate-binding protein [Lichenicoccus roseus]TLU71877.1 cation ABC transporter substrate-binding protein [Lichenicoccus roseus]
MRRLAAFVTFLMSAGLPMTLPPGPADAAVPPGQRLRIVAAENVYGDVAAQLAGHTAQVTSVLSNPNQDPHLFEASPSVARALSHATITISNGNGYDGWMAGLLAASPAPDRHDIVVADLLGARAGSNPHLWYDPQTMRTFANGFTRVMDATDAPQAAAHAAARDRFLGSLAPVQARIDAIRARFGGTSVTATEPVFGLMSNALGLVMRNERFQVAVMNDAEPRPSDVVAFEDDLRGHKVAVLFYNSQASDTAARRLLGLARQAGIPVVGVTETEPAGMDYQHWMLSELDLTGRALAQAQSRPARP